MNRSHVIRLNPTPDQEVYFRKACGVTRHAYNWALDRWKAARAEGETGHDESPQGGVQQHQGRTISVGL